MNTLCFVQSASDMVLADDNFASIVAVSVSLSWKSGHVLFLFFTIKLGGKRVSLLLMYCNDRLFHDQLWF